MHAAATALFSTPSDRIFNENCHRNLVVKESLGAKCVDFYASFDVNEEEKIERPACFSVHVDTYAILNLTDVVNISFREPLTT